MFVFPSDMEITENTYNHLIHHWAITENEVVEKKGFPKKKRKGSSSTASDGVPQAQPVMEPAIAACYIVTSVLIFNRAMPSLSQQQVSLDVFLQEWQLPF